MDKLRFPNGGVSLEADDFRYTDAGIREAILGLAKIFGDTFRISGVELVQVGATTEYNYTAGYAVLNGEVMKVDASAAPIDIAALPYIYIEEDISYPASGVEVLENSTTDNTYEQRRAKLVGYASAQSGALYAATKLAGTLMSEIIQQNTHAFTARQSWAQGTDQVMTTGVGIIPMSNSEGNSYNLNINAADTLTDRFSAGHFNGTWLAVMFTGTADKQIKIGNADATSSCIRTPGGEEFIFKTGETALFIYKDSRYWLVNANVGAWKLRSDVADVTSGGGGGVAVVSCNIQYKITGKTMVMAFNFSATNVTAPTGFLLTIPESKTANMSIDVSGFAYLTNGASKVVSRVVVPSAPTNYLTIEPFTALTDGAATTCNGEITFQIL